MYSFVVYLYVNGSGSITSVGEERANLSAVVNLWLCGFSLERFPLPLGAWDGLRYFIVAVHEPSIYLFFIFLILLLHLGEYVAKCVICIVSR